MAIMGSVADARTKELVLKAEEPGSKQLLAFRARSHRTIAYDLVNHLLNDVVVMGAAPIAVLDTIICGTLERAVVVELGREIAQACRDGTYYPKHYTILQFVPNVLMAFFRTDFDHYHCAVLLYEPVRHDRTILHAWAYPAPFPGHRSWARTLTDPVRSSIVRRYVEMVLREDNLVCERIQGNAHQIGRAPLLGRLEERIGWFEESYRKLMAAREDD